jgi:predicted TIM-barrel fold metal-dependent hydrolase
MLDRDKRPVITDAHAHLYDWRENTYTFLEKTNIMFQSLIGDYDLLPRVFGLQDYIELNSQVKVAGVVWHEFLSTDPIREVRWAQQLAPALPAFQWRLLG